MTNLHRFLCGCLSVLLGAFIVVGPADASGLVNPVTSDSNGDTAMGTDALKDLSGGAGQNTAAGSGALESNATGAGNTAIGTDALRANTEGAGNTASGDEALCSNTTGSYNTAFGTGALYLNTTGNFNSATGYEALFSNKTGTENAASGYQALYANTTGSYNTASGFQALYFNETGYQNTASGFQALYVNETGYQNTASGYQALYKNTTGNSNTVSGSQALYTNTTGDENTASGTAALYTNTTGSANTAHGIDALYSNTTGNTNTAYGAGALFYEKTGAGNIGLGYLAGSKLTTGSNDIDIGNVGVAAESAVIRIGTSSVQEATYIAGIYEATVNNPLPVYIDSSGQLGTVKSSERFKTAIEPMGSNTAKLAQLRPVTFHLSTDPEAATRYGLIAEEVAKIYPELVVRDQTGRIDGVRYDELAPMLLNEVQRQQQMIAAQQTQINQLMQQSALMQAALVKLQSRDDLLAQR